MFILCNCVVNPPDVDTPGFKEEMEYKPEETKVLPLSLSLSLFLSPYISLFFSLSFMLHIVKIDG